ncbi:hypothetical protein [Vallicoccus soli]|uniref:hypothetical protein n=1 Tax=Vallicoccus soli TaxID=2339232 RepID=UPI001C49A038|nr:hypothetical protein [Vallicoccus soli]
MRALLVGAAAGAAGTTALDAVTYVDMALRGRPASSTPEQSVERLADRAHVRVPGEGEQQDARVSGLGPLLGIASGVGVGVLYGAVRDLGWRPSVLVGGLATAAAAMVGTNGPMAVLGVSDPRTWSASSWVSDVVPHLAYGLVTAATAAAAER